MSTVDKSIQQIKQEWQQMTERLNKVEQDVSEIKDMLKQLIER